MNTEFHKLVKVAADKYVRRHYYKNAWATERKTFLAGARFARKSIKGMSLWELLSLARGSLK